jgi:hypothetical protein
MADKKFIIEVRTKGFSRATKDFQDLDKNTRDYNKAADRLRGSTNGLIGSLGSLRNRLLVYGFALGGATVFVNKFVQASSGFEDVKTRLVGLTGSVQGAEAAFDRFNAIASTTPFQLQDVVNAGAQLEAFGVDSKATLSALTDLAAFMGTNATEAASALGRAFAGGAGAADILRERGILQIIKDSQGIKDLSKITLPEFRKALINALADPDGRIAGSAERLSETFTGAMSNMQDQIVRVQAVIGDILMPSLMEAIKATQEFLKGINKKELAEGALAISLVSSAFLAYKIQANLAAITTLKFGVALKKIGIGSLLAIAGLAFDKLFELMGTFDHLTEEIKEFDKEIKQGEKDLKAYAERLANAADATNEMESSSSKAETAMEKFRKSLDQQEKSLVLQLMSLTDASDQMTVFAETGELVSKSVLDQLAEIRKLKSEVDRLTEAEKLRNDNIKLATDRSVELQDALILVNTARKSEKEDVESNVEAQQRRLDVINEIGQVLQAEDAVLANLKNSFDVNTASIDENSKFLQVANDFYVGLTKEQANAISVIVRNAQANNLLTAELEKAAQAVKEMEEQNKASIDRQKTFINLFAQTEEGQRKNIEATIKMVEENRKLFAELGNVDAVLAKLKDDLSAVGSDLNNVGSDVDSTSNSSQKAAASINVLAGAMSALKGDTKDAGQMFGVFLRTVGSLLALSGNAVGGAGLNLLSSFFAHTGGLITNRGIQRFANGGVVQGQDNVPIMAQAGEFVMRREAVQNIGVQNLAQMNRTGDAGGVTVNISAPLVDETVIDHIIPAINKATNRNLA